MVRPVAWLDDQSRWRHDLQRRARQTIRPRSIVAQRETHNLSTTAQIDDYRASGYATANGLDSRYGAGRSMRRTAIRSSPPARMKQVRCCAEPPCESAPASITSRASAGTLLATELQYNFTATDDRNQLSASLVWNLDVDQFRAAGGASLRNLGLSLYDETTGQQVGSSVSLIDNTQNLWYSLVSGRQYRLTCPRWSRRARRRLCARLESFRVDDARASAARGHAAVGRIAGARARVQAAPFAAFMPTPLPLRDMSSTSIVPMRPGSRRICASQ